nr:RNA-dependent RNA polymerase [Grapevine leafroll-associated virus 1]
MIAFESIECFSAAPQLEKYIMAKVSTSHVQVVNLFLESRVPGITSFNTDFWEDDFEVSGLDTLVETATISDNFPKYRVTDRPRLQNVVRSVIGRPKRNSLKCNLVTFESRNFNADRGCDVSSDPIAATELASLFFDTWVDGSKLAECVGDTISQNAVAASSWLDSRSSMAKQSLWARLRSFVYDLSAMTRYKLMVKSDAKPKLDSTPLQQYVTGQNIVYHDRAITAMFSHIFTQAVERLKYVLQTKVLAYHGMSTEDFSREVGERLGDVSGYYVYELDISKYDKSQGACMKDVERRILIGLGVSESVVDAFFCGEYDSVVTMGKNELVLSVGAQRRSGGANTWLGNTLVLMTLLAISLKGSEPSLVVVCGDDSLIFSKNELLINDRILEESFGFDLKLTCQCAPYFCSKYLVRTPDHCYFLPDPFKLFLKLSLEREPNEDLLFEVFTSFVDLTRGFGDESAVQQLVAMDAQRYGPNPYAYAAFCLVHILAANFVQFKRLFYDADGMFGKNSKSKATR